MESRACSQERAHGVGVLNHSYRRILTLFCPGTRTLLLRATIRRAFVRSTAAGQIPGTSGASAYKNASRTLQPLAADIRTILLGRDERNGAQDQQALERLLSIASLGEPTEPGVEATTFIKMTSRISRTQSFGRPFKAGGRPETP